MFYFCYILAVSKRPLGMETLIYRYFQGCYSSCSLLHRIAVPTSADSAVWNTCWKGAFVVLYCCNTLAMSTRSLGVKRAILSTVSMLLFLPLISSNYFRSTTICGVGHFELLLDGRLETQERCRHTVIIYFTICSYASKFDVINMT